MTAQSVGSSFARLAERRLAEKEIRIARNICKLRARGGIARVRKRSLPVRDTHAVRAQLVMRYANRRHLEAGRLERLVLGILADIERLGEHAFHAELVREEV